MYNSHYEEIPFGEIPDWKLIGTAEYADSIYKEGILNPVLLATWNGELCMVGGNRRVLSLQKAHARAEGDGTLADRPHLHFLRAIIYEDVPPSVQSAWALRDNEERSENPLHMYITIKTAQQRGDWDEVGKLYRLNKGRMDKVMAFEGLIPEILEALIEGRITKTNALECAKMPPDRQRYVVGLADAEAKAKREKKGNHGEEVPVVLTGTHIHDAQTARVNAVMSTMSEVIVPKQAANAIVENQIFIVLADLDELNKAGKVFTSFKSAFEEKKASGNRLFRLVEF